MNLGSLNYIVCPACKGEVSLQRALTLLKSDSGAEAVEEGILQCRGCRALYPIMAGVPRMVRLESMFPDEKAFLRSPPPGGKEVHRPVLSEAQRRARIEKIVESRFDLSLPSASLRARVRHEIDYQVRKTEKEEKVFFTIYPFLKKMPAVIADIGGGQGGLISCLRKFFRPAASLVLDYDLSWIEVARLRDPQIEVIRGDAAWLPFGEKAIDLMVTMSTLEHIPDWHRALREMARSSKTLFLSYGPNRYAFFDKGHLDAPLFPFLPEEMSCRMSHFWHKVRRTGRSYGSILQEYRRTHYIPRHRVEATLRQFGTTTNVWNDFFFHSVRSDYHYVAAGPKRFLRKHYMIQALFSLLLESLGIEPNVYLILQRD